MVGRENTSGRKKYRDKVKEHTRENEELRKRKTYISFSAFSDDLCSQ